MKRQTMSVAFADLAHFERLIEAQGEQRAIECLQAALVAAGDAAVRHGGQVRKYIGDAIMLSFDDAGQAVAAAKEIAAYHRQVGDLAVRYYVAVATGEVIVTQLGHPSHVAEDILGHTVNRAAKLLKQAASNPDRLALDYETQKHA